MRMQELTVAKLSTVVGDIVSKINIGSESLAITVGKGGFEDRKGITFKFKVDVFGTISIAYKQVY